MTKSIFLASKSPRRRELLTQIGVNFSVVDIDVPEEHQNEETAVQYVERLAISKARAGALLCESKPVMGADTIVVLSDRILEKPKNQAHGIEMLMAMSSRTHSVYTAIAICQEGREEAMLCQSQVRFRLISTDEALRYWQTGEPCDKAGGYGIQGLGAVFVEHIEGSYSNVVGMPLRETQQLLEKFDIPVWA